jgi:hypothetical protein
MMNYWNSAVSWVSTHPGTALLLGFGAFLAVLVL